jgi:hypothetical protein
VTSAAPSPGFSAAPVASGPPPVATPRPTSPVAVPNLPPGWKTWYSPNWHLALGYPAEWTASQHDRFDAIQSPDGAIVILFDTGPNQPVRSLDQIASDDASIIKSRQGWMLETSTTDKMGDRDAVWITYHLVATNGQGYEGVDVYAIEGGTAIEVTWIGPAQPNEDQLAMLHQVLDTITLTP